jgi:tetratricopeptide (TPR) repeat protein
MWNSWRSFLFAMVLAQSLHSRSQNIRKSLEKFHIQNAGCHYLESALKAPPGRPEKPMPGEKAKPTTLETIMNSTITTCIILCISLAAFGYAQESRSAGPGASIDPDYFAQCYRETVKASKGADPSTLSTRPCTKGLRASTNRVNQAALLHNRGIVLVAQGHLDEARLDFERSVGLSSEVGMPHIALAQLAHRQGDYETAIAMYDLALSSGTDNPAVQRNLALIRENRDRAENRMSNAQVAGLSPGQH